MNRGNDSHFGANLPTNIRHPPAYSGVTSAWGDNLAGQLGDGTTTKRHTPVQVQNLSRVKAIYAGENHSLALKTDRTVRAWGDNWAGQLGDETTTLRLTPVKVHSLNGVKAIATHTSHSLALKTDGTVWAWGFNAYGQVGDGTSGSFADRTAPVQVQNLSQVKAISTGLTHSLAKVSKPPGAEQ